MSGAAHSADFYVSPLGQDANSGSSEAPFATIERALQAVRAYIQHSPDEMCKIWLDDGIYRIDEPLQIRSEDFTDIPGLTISALPGAYPSISGGRALKNWERTTAGLWKADLPQEVLEKGMPRELFVGDRRAIRARYPNTGYLRVAKAGEDRRTYFYFEENDFPMPVSPEQTELILLHDWSISRIAIKAIDRTAQKLMTVDSIGARQPAFFNIDNWEPQPRYFLENDRQFVDADYEWYFDTSEKAVFIQLPVGQDPAILDIVIPVSPGLVKLSGNIDRPLKNIQFQGLTFEHAFWNIPAQGYAGIQACHYDDRPGPPQWDVVPAAIQGSWVDQITFEDCTFRHLGGSGIWLGTGSKNNRISNCELYDISGNGIMIGEGQDRKVNGEPWWKVASDQVAIDNTIKDNKISNCGIQFFGGVGIWCGLTARTSILRNEVHDLPYTGISIGWMWNPVPTPCRENMVEGNHIHHIMQKLSDGGGIYMLGLQPGSKILHNRIHDVSINAGRAESNGMFLDEGTTDVLVAGNLIYNIAKSPLRFHRATTNTVRENLLFCNEGEVPIRYNTTNENDILKIDNQVLTKGEDGYDQQLRQDIERWDSQ